MPVGAAHTGRAVVVIDAALDWGRRIGGLTVLTRTIAGLARVGCMVHVHGFDRLPASQRETACAELAAMPLAPIWQPTDLAAGEHPSVVVTAPGLFDPRGLDLLLGEHLGRDPLAGVNRPNAPGRPFLWFVGDATVLDAIDLTDQHKATLGLSAACTGRIDPGAVLCDPIAGASDRELEDRLLRTARKATDTWVARTLDRPISLALTRRMLPHPISPNQITVVGTSIGLAGVGLLGLGSPPAQLVGALLLTCSIIVDGCDGEVARLKFLESEFGRKLDFFLDNVVNVTAIFAVGAGYAAHSGDGRYLVLATVSAAAAAASVAPVYLLFFRAAKAGGAATTKAGPARLLEGIAGRDFAYLILLLACFGRAHWFTWICAGGIGVFLGAALLLLIAERLRRPAPHVH